MSDATSSSPKFRTVHGLVVSEETLDMYSQSEIKERAWIAAKWFATYAIAQVNHKALREKVSPPRYSPY